MPAPTNTLRLRNGPKSTPAHIVIEVNGVIETNGSGRIAVDLANETIDIPFRGTITKFAETTGDGQFSVSIEGVSFRARDVAGYDTRTGARKEPTQDVPVNVAPQPENPPATRDISTADLPNPAEGDDAIGAGLWHPSGQDKPQEGLVGRFEKTDEDVTIRVDSNRSGGVQEAFNRLPREIEHEVVVDLGESGTHGGNGSAVRTGRIFVHSCGDLLVRGGGHGDVRVTSGINAMCTSSKQSHLTLSGIHFDGLSQFAGPVDLRDCRFSGFSKPGVNSTGTAAISGKNGQVHAKRCIVGESSDTYGIWATIQERYVLIDCTIRGRVAAINAAPGCDVKTVGGRIEAPRKFA